jgi:hypothetical protein
VGVGVGDTSIFQLYLKYRSLCGSLKDLVSVLIVIKQP